MRLQALLHWKTPQALGHLCLLWLWALDSAPDGRLRDVSPAELARAVQFNPSRGGELIEALLAAGFLDRDADGTLRIHDWDSYGGKVLKARDRNIEKCKSYRSRPRSQPRSRPRIDNTTEENTTQDNTTQDNTRQDEREEYARENPAPRPQDAIPLSSSSMTDEAFRKKLAALESYELMSWCLACAKAEGRDTLSGSEDCLRLRKEFQQEKG